MSSIDSGVHSVTTALIVDFRDRLFPGWKPSTEAREMLVARSMVVLIGVIAITLACYVGQLGDVFAVAKKSIGAFAAPLLSIFILGLFVPRATAFGVFFWNLDRCRVDAADDVLVPRLVCDVVLSARLF